MTAAAANPYTVILNQGKVPFGLLNDPFKNARMNLLSTESFGDTFGAKSRRKRPKLAVTDLSAMASTVETSVAAYGTWILCFATFIWSEVGLFLA